MTAGNVEESDLRPLALQTEGIGEPWVTGLVTGQVLPSSLSGRKDQSGEER
jgi:hypothetical protein